MFKQLLSRCQHPYALLVMTMIFWSGNMVIGRALRTDVPPISLAFWRWAIALGLTLPFALPHLRTQWPLLKKGWRPIVVLGLLGISGYNTLAYIALQYTAATNAVLINAFIPIATMVLAWLVLHKRLSPVEWLGVAISFTGVMSIVARGELSTLVNLSLNIGDLWMLVAVFAWAFYTIGLHWRPQGVHPMLMLAAITTVGVLILAPFYAWEILQGRSIHFSLASLSGIIYTGTLPSFVGYVFYNRAVNEIGAGKASLFIHLMPVFGLLLSVIFLDERPHLYHFFGIGLIFTGIYLCTVHKPK